MNFISIHNVADNDWVYINIEQIAVICERTLSIKMSDGSVIRTDPHSLKKLSERIGGDFMYDN